MIFDTLGLLFPFRRFLFLVLAGRAVVAAGAVGGGAAPDALVAAGAVAVLFRGGIVAARAVARRTAPFAVFLVVAVLMLASGRMIAARAVARRSAMSAFSAHVISFDRPNYTKILYPRGV